MVIGFASLGAEFIPQGGAPSFMVIGCASLASRHWARSLSRKAGHHHSWSLAARHWALRAIIHGHWLRVIQLYTIE